MTAYLANHGEDLVSGRVYRQYHYPSPGRPLPQILDQEEGVKYVHPVSGLQ